MDSGRGYRRYDRQVNSGLNGSTQLPKSAGHFCIGIFSRRSEISNLRLWREVLVHQSDGTGLIARLIGKSDRIESIAYTPDGKILVVSGGIPIHIN